MKTPKELAERIYHRRTQMNALDAKDEELIEYFADLIKDYSDQQNKELREKHEKQIADWKREEKMWGEHELHYKAEIQRLTKEVEELKGKVEHRTGELVVKVDELTRLRELLGRTSVGLSNLVFTADKLWDEVKPIKDSNAITVTHPIIEEAKQLLTEIDNALNHKP